MSPAPDPAAVPAPPLLLMALASVTALIGAAMIVVAIAGGGGPGAYGVLIGVLFLAAGLLRIKSLRGRARAAVAREGEDAS